MIISIRHSVFKLSVYPMLLLFTLAFSSAFATHNRAGEIIYEKLPGIHRYKITIITYTEINNNNADRDTLTLNLGDGTSKSVQRTSRDPGFAGYPDIQRNKYETTHTYTGPGKYLLSMLDPNRNGGIVNIPSSIDRKFYIESELNITLTQENSSPVLLNPPIAFACLDKPFYYNPGAFDPEGDSLVYSLVECKADFGLPIPDYAFPATSNIFNIDSNTGILTWDAPITAGEYNIAILIKEYRNGVSGNGRPAIFEVGSVLRDMQITVIPGCTNEPPEILNVRDYCVTARDTLAFTVKAFDTKDGTSPSNGNTISLEAFGGPFEIDPVATFSTNVGIDSTIGNFYWITACNHVLKNPYTVTYKATDNGIPPLSNYQVSDILVVAPPVENVTAEAKSSNIELNWDPEICSDAIGYMIYRRSGESGFVPDSCVTGVPPDIGYELIYTGEDYNETTYIDDNDGKGLIPGEVYCYLIVAYFNDGAESYASEEVCAQLNKDVPILTNVSVEATDATSGEMYVAWSPPSDHNTSIYPGPYRYKVLRTTRRDLENFQVIGQNDGFTDTTYQDTELNTFETEYTYRIEMFDLSTGSEVSMGNSVVGTSIYLRSVAKDNEIVLNWNELVPWRNLTYTILKENSEGIFDTLGTTIDQQFRDTNLHNGRQYCYRVFSSGEYSLPSIHKPIINYSQEHCAIPIDLQAPCPPNLSLFVEDCESVQEYLTQNDLRCQNDGVSTSDIEQVEVSWTNPNLTCDTTDDVMLFNLYYSTLKNGAYDLIHVVDLEGVPVNQQQTEYEFIHRLNNTRAGCYYITAIDSFDNVSPVVDTVCTDNCLLYDLPNVFTPNGDNVNDFFEPFPFCYIDKIELTVFNRWGNPVFKTDDPNVRWDGINQNTSQPCPDGVYFYTCKVDQISVEGTKEVELKGVVHILGTDQKEDF